MYEMSAGSDILCAAIIVYDWPWFMFIRILDPAGYHIKMMVSCRGFKVLAGFSMMLARNISSRNLPSISLLYNMIVTVRFILEYAALSRMDNINSARLYIIRLDRIQYYTLLRFILNIWNSPHNYILIWSCCWETYHSPIGAPRIIWKKWTS